MLHYTKDKRCLPITTGCKQYNVVTARESIDEQFRLFPSVEK